MIKPLRQSMIRFCSKSRINLCLLGRPGVEGGRFDGWGLRLVDLAGSQHQERGISGTEKGDDYYTVKKITIFFEWTQQQQKV